MCTPAPLEARTSRKETPVAAEAAPVRRWPLLPGQGVAGGMSTPGTLLVLKHKCFELFLATAV